MAPVALAAAAWLAAPRIVHACSCRPPKPPVQALGDADAVFIGVAVSMTTAPRGKVRYGFRVSRTWKGARTKAVDLQTHSQSSACGRSFQLGTTYLVYARAGDGGWVDGLCSRTRPLSRALLDIEALDRFVGSEPSPLDDPPASPASGDLPLEPPRIVPAPQSAPPVAPSKRGCTVATPTAPPLVLPLWALLCLRRRRNGPPARAS